LPQVTLADISKIIFRNSRLFIPKCIEHAIEQTVENSADAINLAGEELMARYGPQDAPIKFNYDRSDIVDAYGIFYTRRNVIVPRIALRDMVLNSKLQKFRPRIRVLDLGSGTGAVVLGLLEMFQHAPLDSISVDIDAVDIAQKVLTRLKRLVEAAGLTPRSIVTINQDVTDVRNLTKKLLNRGKYDLIFSANLFGELTDEEATGVLDCIIPHLSDEGMIFIVNAPKDPFIKMMPKLVEKATEMNLTIYYPCPPNKSHSCDECWFWRENEYDRGFLKVGDRIMDGRYREQLTASWLTLCTEPYTIYDDFVTQYKDLDWGPLSVFGPDSATCDCQICISSGIRNRLRIGKLIKRGSIVGGAGEPFSIAKHYEL